MSMNARPIAAAWGCLFVAACSQMGSPDGPPGPGEASVSDDWGDPPCVVESPRVIPANPRFVADVDHGRLEMKNASHGGALVEVWLPAAEG